MSTRPQGRGRPAPSRGRPGRRISVGLAVLFVLLALAVGVLVGYVAHGDEASGQLLTETREVPVVTVTVPATR